MPSAILAVKVIADASKAVSGLNEAEKSTSKWSSGLNKAAGVAAVGLAAVGAVMVDGVKSAAEDAQAQAVLATALKKSAGATDAQVAATEDWITKTALATGVADDQLRPALGALVRATGDVGEAQEGMGLAMDLSTATGKDLQSISEALAKAYGGNTASLGKLVPSIDKATLASGDMEKISAELASQVGGSTAAAADTAAGQYKIFQVALDETKEGIGAGLLPILNNLMTQMSGVSKWAANNTGAITVLIGVYAALAATVITVNAVTKAWTAVTKVATIATTAWKIAVFALNVAWAANPLGVVIVAVIALGAALVLAYQKSETFRRIVDAAFDAVTAAAKAAWNWIKANWPLLLAILTGPIGAAVLVIARNWDHIKDGAQSVLSWLRSAWGAIRDILVGPFESAWSAISGIIDKIRGAVSSITSLIKSIPKPSVPHIPGLNAAAGYSTALTGPRVASLGATAAATGAPAARGGGTTINITAIDPESAARAVAKVLTQHGIRTGRLSTIATAAPAI